MRMDTQQADASSQLLGMEKRDCEYRPPPRSMQARIAPLRLAHCAVAFEEPPSAASQRGEILRSS